MAIVNTVCSDSHFLYCVMTREKRSSISCGIMHNKGPVDKGGEYVRSMVE